MMRHRSIGLAAAAAFAVVAADQDVSAAPTMAANTKAPTAVPQNIDDYSRLIGVLRGVKLPTRFKISLFARVPVTVRHHGSPPYYQPSGDHLVTPALAHFHATDD